MGLGIFLKKQLEDLLDVRHSINQLQQNRSNNTYTQQQQQKRGGLHPSIKAHLKQYVKD